MTSTVQFILTPTIAVLTGAAVWLFRSRLDALQRQADRLHSDRAKLYANILEPYILAFSNAATESEIEAMYMSLDYRRTIFELNMVGSDRVVRAMNSFMQYFYSLERQGESPAKDPKVLMRLFGSVLLEIRKDLGNRRTKLNTIDMLRSQIKDIDRYLTD